MARIAEGNRCATGSGEGGFWKQRMLLAVKAGLMQTTANHTLICAGAHVASLLISLPRSKLSLAIAPTALTL